MWTPQSRKAPAKARQGLLRIARVAEDAAGEYMKNGGSLHGGHGGGVDGGFVDMTAKLIDKRWYQYRGIYIDNTIEVRLLLLQLHLHA